MTKELMFQPLRKYAEFRGRARRAEYWLFYLFVVLVVAAAGVLGLLLGGDSLSELVQGVAVLAFLIPMFSASFRRLHDTGRSAWWLLIGLIPIVGAVVLLVFYVLPGTPGPNRYGPDPKAAPEDAAAPAIA